MREKNNFHPSSIELDLSKYDNSYEFERIRIIKGMIPDGQKKLAVDVGCGPEFFSGILSEKIWNVTAIDTNNANLSNIKNYASLTILGDAVTALDGLQSDGYDFPLTLEVIGHMPKPIGEEVIKQSGS